MIDQLWDRQYQSGRRSLHSGVERIITALAETFSTIHDVQFKSPWKSRSKDVGCA